MINYRAAWVVPICSPPIRNGWVSVDRGRIVAVATTAPPHATVHDLGDVVLLPGLVNAHTHLELSHLRGRVGPSPDFVGWVRQLLALRGREQDPRDPRTVGGVEEGIAESIRCGTAVLGDISNTLVTFAPLVASPLAAIVFRELIGFRTTDPPGFVEKAMEELVTLKPTERVRASLAAHAPYSVAAPLFRAIRGAVECDRLGAYSVHLSESEEEVELIAHGSGPWRAFLEELGVWDDSWVAPGGSPVTYLDDLGFLGPGAVVVHGVQMSSMDLSRLAASGATLVTCPRSNEHTGAGVPPLDAFYASGVRVAIGTDSLASAPDLSIFSELAVMRRLAPSIAASVLLDSATRQGALALGFGDDYGTIEAGKCARLLTVSIPAGVGDDIEEFLLSGIEPNRISWVP